MMKTLSENRILCRAKKINIQDGSFKVLQVNSFKIINNIKICFK